MRTFAARLNDICADGSALNGRERLEFLYENLAYLDALMAGERNPPVPETIARERRTAEAATIRTERELREKEEWLRVKGTPFTDLSIDNYVLNWQVEGLPSGVTGWLEWSELYIGTFRLALKDHKGQVIRQPLSFNCKAAILKQFELAKKASPNVANYSFTLNENVGWYTLRVTAKKVGK